MKKHIRIIKDSFKFWGWKKGTIWFFITSYLFVYAKCKLFKKSTSNISFRELSTARKGGTVFVFGSGYSLNDLSAEEWSRIREYDTIGFSGFGIHQEWLNLDFYLIRGWAEGWDGIINWKSHVLEFIKPLRSNTKLDKTTYILQHEFTAIFGNSLIALSGLKNSNKWITYHTAPKSSIPSLSWEKGICHNTGTLFDTLNFAFLGGWKKIVLVGVDLYDSRYFWLEEDETEDMIDGKMVVSNKNDRGDRYDETHNTVKNNLVEQVEQWATYMKKNGVSIECYNPRSLLVPTMPVFKW